MTGTLFKDLFKVFKRERDEDGVNPQTQLVTVHQFSQSSTDKMHHARFDIQYEKGVIVGEGAHAVVRMATRTHGSNGFLAIKEFRHKKESESEKEYIKRLTSEFCIGSSLHHSHIIETLDLIQNGQKHWCEIMEYCEGGDLMSLLQTVKLDQCQVYSYFSQLMSGVRYLHQMGVAHRDLKPENLMLDAKRQLLKIADFGEAEVFMTPYERHPHKTSRLVGSIPYIPPEEYTDSQFDPCAVDIWSCGIIFLVMTFRRFPWSKAKKDDPFFARFKFGHVCAMLQELEKGPRELITRMLDVNPETRLTIRDIYKDPWFSSISELES